MNRREFVETYGFELTYLGGNASVGLRMNSLQTTGGSTLGSGSVNGGSSLSGDTQLRGLAAAGSSNSAYQSSYRDCMKRRGF